MKIRITISEHIDPNGKSPFQVWFSRLDTAAAAKVSTALYRLELGNFSNIKSLKGGLYEYKLHWGPGYRIYFGQDGDKLVILLGGGTKHRQSADIQNARKRWEQYKQLLRRGELCH